MERAEAEKVDFHSFLPHFFLLAMYEAVLLNNFFKTVQLHIESCLWSYFQKNSFNNEAELCQTEPK